MKSTFCFNRTNRARIGASLVITLVLLALLSAILVGLFLSSRLEVLAARMYLEGARARSLAQEATGLATAQLAATIGDHRHYVSQPGVIRKVSLGGEITVDLFSRSTSGDLVDLNRKGAFNRHPIDPLGATLNVGWLYVLQDGSILDTLPVLDAANPVVGRYAWWTDDASTRINLNTAWTRSSDDTQPLNDPAQIELGAIPGTNRAAWHELPAKRAGRWFVDPLEAAREEPALSSPIDSARFSLTARSHTPELWNCFAQPKIALTTRPERAAGLPYLDISTPVKTQATVNRIIELLTRSDWPIAAGSSFLSKYYADHPERAPQLAFNIVDYVRCRENSSPIVIPSRVTAPGEQFLGLARTPLITELAVEIADTPTAANRYPFKVIMEVHLPKDYGLAEVSLAGLYLWWSLAPDAGGYQFVESVIQPGECSPAPVLKAGGYAVITRSMGFFANVRPRSLSMRVALSTSNGANRFQICPLVYTDDLGKPGNSSLLNYPVGPAGVIRSLEVADPRVNQGVRDWVRRTSGNSFGSVNSIYGVGTKAGGIVPPPDTDADGNYSDASLVMPAPAGSAGNPHGQVESIAELGLIHTGISGAANSQGVPWRTVRLQPSLQPANIIPDWALLDLFTPPPPVSSEAVAPCPGSIGGRININAAMKPFDTVQRRIPLCALWNGIPEVVSPENLATNVLSYLQAPPNKWGLSHAFTLRGEVLEVPDVADAGESTEKPASRYLDQVAVNGNVFVIYSLAQSLQQTPGGKLITQGECLTETFVERTTDLSTGRVGFRTVGFGEIGR